MLGTAYADLLRQEGFQPIGSLEYRLDLSVWWNAAPDRLLQLMVLTLGQATLLKADKGYFLRSVSSEGETWARDIGPLHDYLEAHFPELRIAFSHFRDVPRELAEAELRRRMTVDAPTQRLPSVEQIAALQQQLRASQQEFQATERLMSLSSAGSDLLTSYMRQQTRTQKRQVQHMQEELERQQQRLGLLQHLQREYQRKGSAAIYTFSLSSNVQVARNSEEFQDALRAAVKELVDANRYEVTQKLRGGRLNIQVDEVREPALTWIEQWLGGALSPAQLRRLGPEFEVLRRAMEEHAMVTPDEPIEAAGHVRQAERHLAGFRRRRRCSVGP